MDQTDQNTTTIFLVRHTEVHNPQAILYGRMPRFRLSDRGQRQAEATADLLRKEPLAAIYSSPQLRARQTAKVIAARHPRLKVQLTKILAEVVTGWQGRTHAELHKIDFDFYSHPVNSHDETVVDVWERVQIFVDRVRRNHTGQKVVGVTHGDLCFVARAGFAGMPVTVDSIRGQNVYPGHGSITRLIFGPLGDTYPIKLEYLDPNGPNHEWSTAWVNIPKEGLLVRG